MQSLHQIRLFPSFCSGSVRQTLATLGPRRSFEPRPPRPVVLVPGAFCTGSVMNRLGEVLQERGRSVCVPPSFPYYFSALANTCRVPRATRLFLRWLDEVGPANGFSEVDVAGHSNGGLIALAAQDLVDRGEDTCAVSVHKVVTMAAPFGGFPGARALAPVLPFCRDIETGSEILQRAERARGLLAGCLVAERDFLIPPVHQIVPGVDKVVMQGFQHMDFIVGSPAKVERTADEVMRCLTNSL